MGLGMMRQMSANIQRATFFTIMADETADVSNRKQLVICIRWVDVCFVLHEDISLECILWKEQVQIK